MRVLWLSNCQLTSQQTASTGTWLQVISSELVRRGEVELCNITFGNVAEVTRCDSGEIKQWIVPMSKLRNGLPSHQVVNAICRIVDSVSPDLIHIWGVEFYWGILSARGMFNYPTLLEIQGLRYTCADAYYAGMSAREILSSVRWIDMLFTYRRIDRQRAEHAAWGRYEREMLASHNYISTQSQWVRDMIAPYIRKDAKMFRTKMAVRTEFLSSEPWQYSKDDGAIQLLSISSMAVPYKGVHIALKAVAQLKSRYPSIRLKLVGDYMQNRSDIRKIGYVKYIEKLIADLNIGENVEFAGSLSAPEVVREMQKSCAVIHSSFVESYSLALAESMAVGVPCVVSYAGAMPELAEDGRTALYYSPCDYRQCASQIERLITEKTFAQQMSAASRELAQERNNTDGVIATQLEIYRKLLENDTIKD